MLLKSSTGHVSKPFCNPTSASKPPIGPRVDRYKHSALVGVEYARLHTFNGASTISCLKVWKLKATFNLQLHAAKLPAMRRYVVVARCTDLRMMTADVVLISRVFKGYSV